MDENHVWGVSQCIVTRVTRDVPPQEFDDACECARKASISQGFTDEEVSAGIVQAKERLVEDGYQI